MSQAKFKKLRVVVEITLSSTSPINEKDLQSSLMALVPSKMHIKGHQVSPRLKLFASFWPMFLRKEKGLNNFEPKEITDG